MSKDMIDLGHDAGFADLARRLEAFADLRLSPSVAGTTRMRMAVMNAAHRRAALIEADATFDAAGETTAARAARRARELRNAWRRPAGAILAGSLTLVILTGTAIAARPGGPLYAARMWTEMANLPAGLVARAEAEVNRLQLRLDEAEQASTAGDARATEAALAAYSTIVAEAARSTEGDTTARAAIKVTVARHVAVLAKMVDSVPSPARPAAEQALTSTTTALEDLDGTATEPTDRGHGRGAKTDSTTAGDAGKGDKAGDAGEPAGPAGPGKPPRDDARDEPATHDNAGPGGE